MLYGRQMNKSTNKPINELINEAVNHSKVHIVYVYVNMRANAIRTTDVGKIKKLINH